MFVWQERIKFPINNRQIPKVPFSYSPLNSRRSHPPTQRLFTFLVNNIPSHVSIIIVFVIIALLQSLPSILYIYTFFFFNHFYHLFYHHLLWFFFFSLPFLNRQATSSKHGCRFNHMIAISANRITWGCVFDQHLPFYLFIYLFIYLFVTYFLSSLSLDKFLPNSFTTRIIVPRYPQDPSYEVLSIGQVMTKNADRTAKFDGTSENSASRDSSILDVPRRSKMTLLHVARSRDYVCGFQTRYRWYFNEIITETGHVSVCVCVSQMLVSLKFQKPVSAIQISFRRRRFPPLDSKATLVPFFLFYYHFFLFLCRSGREESLKISTREKFVRWNSDYQNPFVRWSFT